MPASTREAAGRPTKKCAIPEYLQSKEPIRARSGLTNLTVPPFYRQGCAKGAAAPSRVADAGAVGVDLVVGDHSQGSLDVQRFLPDKINSYGVTSSLFGFPVSDVARLEFMHQRGK